MNNHYALAQPLNGAVARHGEKDLEGELGLQPKSWSSNALSGPVGFAIACNYPSGQAVLG